MDYEKTHTRIATVQNTELFAIYQRWAAAKPETKESDVLAPNGRSAVDIWIPNEYIDWQNTRGKGEHIPIYEMETLRSRSHAPD